MPNDNSEDFDTNLAHSVQALQALRDNSSTDIFLSYCQANVPSDEDLQKHVHPQQVKEDLQKAGLRW